MIRWRHGLFCLLWDEFQQDRKCVKNHSHLLQGPMKTECISKMRNCFLSGRALLSHVQEVWESRIIREGKLFRVRAACTLSFKCLRSNDLSVTTSSGSQHCFALPEIQGEVSDCVRLEMPCGMQEWEKKETFGLQATELTQTEVVGQPQLSWDCCSLLLARHLPTTMCWLSLLVYCSAYPTTPLPCRAFLHFSCGSELLVFLSLFTRVRNRRKEIFLQVQIPP